MLTRLICFFLMLIVSGFSHATIEQTKGDFKDKFRQLEEVLPTPNNYRNAAGEPGKDYWQQKVDYATDITLNEKKRRLSAIQTVRYTNNSPYRLKYVWVQLEQDRLKPDSVAERSAAFGGIGRRGPKTALPSDAKPARISMAELRRNQFYDDVEIGYSLSHIVDAEGQALEPRDIVPYIKSNVQVPIMAQSDSVLKLGSNAYTKPVAALNILREVITGRELFDFAFQEYSQRWQDKRPTPADLFRTMEEASGIDLDWF